MACAVTVPPDAVLRGERVSVEIRWSGDVASGALSRLSDGLAAGEIELRADASTLVVERLEVARAFRAYGLGSESARLLREYAESGPWTLLRAWAPPNLGLSVYFWSRMGLRPLHGEGPNGGIWFERPV